jgi:hypothetical protein
MTTAIVAGAALVAVVIAVVFLSGGFRGIHDFRPAGSVGGPAGAVAGQFVYTARTANDAAITLPVAVQDSLRQAGLAGQSVEITRVDYAGNVSTSYIDMTPRTGNSSQDPALKVAGRAVPVINAKISGIDADVNDPAGTAGGGRALYTGLTKTDFTSAPVTIISSGLDLANPDNFRSLNWTVTPSAVVTEVKQAGDLPALHGPVTFVLVPTAGRQPQLNQTQKNYLKEVWTALLKAAGATSVTFIDAASTTASSAAPSAPAVPVPAPPGTLIPQVPVGNGEVKCTVPASYFVFNTAELIDTAKTIRDLSPCITAALAAHATFALDGWTSYEGPLNADGTPEFDYAYNRELSQARVETIAGLLVNDLDVPSSAITHMTGHGNVNQPDPDPHSAANRVVVITYTIK